jgi:arylsulfatase A-like enzyme
MATCCDAAGIELPDGCEGRSLLELCSGRDPGDWRESLVVESALNPEVMDNVKAARRNMGRCLVTDRWKYSAWKWGRRREHLVDLERDPGEMVNLAQSARWDPKLQEMRRLLQDWSEHTDDPFQVPGHEILSPGAPRRPE